VKFLRSPIAACSSSRRRRRTSAARRRRRPAPVLGATPLVAAGGLPPRDRGIREKKAELEIRVYDADRPRLNRDGASRRDDVGLTAFQHAAPGVTKIPLVRFSLILIQAERRAARPGAASALGGHRRAQFVGSRPTRRSKGADRTSICGASPAPAAGDRVQLPGDADRDGRERRRPRCHADAGAWPACLKRRVTLHALVDPVASGTLYWIVNRAAQAPAAADGLQRLPQGIRLRRGRALAPAAAKAA